MQSLSNYPPSFLFLHGLSSVWGCTLFLNKPYILLLFLKFNIWINGVLHFFLVHLIMVPRIHNGCCRTLPRQTPAPMRNAN